MFGNKPRNLSCDHGQCKALSRVATRQSTMLWPIKRTIRTRPTEIGLV
jgi:hypothetical protein